MTCGVLTVNESWTVEELATFLEDHAISGAPVVDDEGALRGVVSVTDIARRGAVKQSAGTDAHAYYHHGLEWKVAREESASFSVADDAILVREIMTPMIFSVDPTASVQEVADTMIRGRIHRLFVADKERLLGVVSSLDLLKMVRDG
jgi:CBS domain-containing protein